ncbi:type II toxin-antitoxin system VapC family toxin [Myceligenerans pegani]|uniref:Type II toxin-antitoxin system VapC family toxin n=1 Tax=Myceligenerans pegani TaxID=2776917 RepID=A0ABR9N6A8_9MICO|nr:type II toxin-antitoxin system VapC family toxin [Myceligenerans sp. TRM 65318]MBE1878721.1 type II toxin-antitoxin system VapC family toxin [Myceligenerans sp. TRM 65318]MBE3020992.1 type II toxin-antitoxin system VapC family toxin [Myceligenerans sp. TRM 65318]
MGVTYLLDTHAFVWLLSAPERFDAELRAKLGSTQNQLLVSAVSAMEIATKVRLGKFDEARPLVDTWDRRVEDIDATPLDLTTAHALHAGSMPWQHRDSFDRLLAAQAIVENVVLVTADAAFTGLPGVRIAW